MEPEARNIRSRDQNFIKCLSIPSILILKPQKDENVISFEYKTNSLQVPIQDSNELFPNLEMLHILIHSLPNIPGAKIYDTETSKKEILQTTIQKFYECYSSPQR